MNKKKLLAGTCLSIVLLALAGYFILLPQTQVNSYKQTVAEKQDELNEKLNKVTDLLDRDVFVKSEVEASTVRTDVKAGFEAIKDAESTIGNVEADLTTFSTYPLLDWNDEYKTAITIADTEKAYIKESKAFIAEMKAVLTYHDKTAEFYTDSKRFENALTAAEGSETAEEYAAAIEGAIKNLEPAVTKLAAVEAPASLKESHGYNADATKEFLVLLKELASAVRAEDLEKLDIIGTQVSDKETELTRKNDDFNADFVRKSPLRKLSEKLQELDRTIDRNQASL